MNPEINQLFEDALALLKKMIATPSLSKKEDNTAILIQEFLEEKGIETQRLKNNIWAKNKHFDPSKKTVLLNSHHDTVKPNNGYTKDPFSPIVKDGKLFGLGSNDAGGCLVSLLATFVYFYEKENLAFNLIMAATAEEEISGPDGIALLQAELPEIDLAIVGEPTEMHAAISEKGLMVIDGEAIGKAGHAARNEGVNAVYMAVDDIEWIKSFTFPKESPVLGPIKMTVTAINGGMQHNVVPDSCTFLIDVRSNDAYTNEEIFNIINEHTKSKLKARSFRLQPSFISPEHDFVKIAVEDGAETYGSPTLSDQALLRCTSIKMGPGKSERSHTPDEFILISEIEDGINKYISRLEKYLN